MNVFAHLVKEDTFSTTVSFVKITTLKEHEEVNLEHLKILTNQIKLDNLLKRAIVVDKNTNIILDGHHRLHALKELGYSKIPVTFVDYQSADIQILTWRDGERITKETVLKTALSGRKLPPKTSKHMVAINGELEHISAIEKKVNIPLNKLK